MPAAAPTSDGMTSTGRAPVRDSTAAPPSTPASPKAILPSFRSSNCAVTMAITAMTTSTDTVRNSLSLVPKVWIAHSLTGPGVRSMTTDPTAVRESACGPSGIASSAAAPSATAAAARPASERCGSSRCATPPQYGAPG
ncbi:Uncharacterised protein [Mycobacteroides abscessus subsp. abscessus]|nr:Uncharacterised protein [Mycobacteroides abscessus subsp. abscessus]